MSADGSKSMKTSPAYKELIKVCFHGSGPEVIKLFSCSTQLSTKFQLLIKTKIPKNDDFDFKFLALSLSDVFIMPINVKMPTIVGI